MKTRDVLEKICATAKGVTVGDRKVFDAVEIFDADDPAAQAEKLDNADGRFCLVVHDSNEYQFTRSGRLVNGSKTLAVSLLVSNSKWAAADAGRVPALEAVDALIDALALPVAAEFILTVKEAGRYSSPAPGTAADRLIYRVAVSCAMREKITVELSR